MNKSILIAAILFAQVAAAPIALAEAPADGCAAFEWDISRELAVMRGEPEKVSASTKGGKIPVVRTNQHYKIDLLPQAEIEFLAKPEREARSESPRGAVLQFSAQAAGRYRVSLSTRHWIDLLVDGKIVASANHQGRAGCQYLHKVVEFDLPANSVVVLQISGQDDTVISLGITTPAA